MEHHRQDLNEGAREFRILIRMAHQGLAQVKGVPPFIHFGSRLARSGASRENGGVGGGVPEKTTDCLEGTGLFMCEFNLHLCLAELRPTGRGAAAASLTRTSR